MTMPEEVNRMETDSIITLYFYQIATSSNEVAISSYLYTEQESLNSFSDCRNSLVSRK